jgi:hypothetical protein
MWLIGLGGVWVEREDRLWRGAVARGEQRAVAQIERDELTEAGADVDRGDEAISQERAGDGERAEVLAVRLGRGAEQRLIERCVPERGAGGRVVDVEVSADVVVEVVDAAREGEQVEAVWGVGERGAGRERGAGAVTIERVDERGGLERVVE